MEMRFLILCFDRRKGKNRQKNSRKKDVFGIPFAKIKNEIMDFGSRKILIPSLKLAVRKTLSNSTRKGKTKKGKKINPNFRDSFISFR